VSVVSVRLSALLLALFGLVLAPVATAEDVVQPKPVPRAKPQGDVARPLPARPRAKPAADTPVEVKPSGPEPIPMPTAAQIEAGMLPCGEACAEILFKTIDGCLWVQSQNPRPIYFQATVDGRLVVLSLEGASYQKSAMAPPEGASAFHARQKDPFQSSSAGIPVYRVRLGDKGSCVTDRGQISQFVAIFKK
jgi:hypothetical protein